MMIFMNGSLITFQNEKAFLMLSGNLRKCGNNITTKESERTMPITIYVRGNKIDIASKIKIIYNNNKILIDFLTNYTGMCISVIITTGSIRMMFN